MARPKAKELTERELEVMHLFWEHSELSIAEAQELLSKSGRELAYTTVATLVKILCDKGFMKQTTEMRPHRFKPTRSYREVSGSLLKDLVQRVFGGSREALLVRLMEEKKLTDEERAALEKLVQGETQPEPNDPATARPAKSGPEKANRDKPFKPGSGK